MRVVRSYVMEVLPVIQEIQLLHCFLLCQGLPV